MTAIETITKRLDHQKQTLADHGLFWAAKQNRIPDKILKEFAFHQYSDSIVWIPMLSLMKQKVVSCKRLRKAIEDNICCEAGVGGRSHVDLARTLMRSLGLKSFDRMPAKTFAKSASLWLSDEFNDFGETEIAGWLLTAETLVPMMFAAMVGSFKNLDADVAYFTEHMDVDSDEHSVWMLESVREILDGGADVADILAGMEDAFKETMEIPDYYLERL